MPFRFNMLLDELGIAPSDVRLLRHQPKVGSTLLLDVWRTDRTLFDDYQSHQVAARRSYFAGKYWVSFVGSWDGRTLFTGLYSVGAPTTINEEVIAPISGNSDAAGTIDLYPFEHLGALEPYEGRLFIDWGGGASGKRAWIQRADQQDKLITELHLSGAEMPFPGTMELTAPLSALADAPPSWMEPLSAARGVYLLTCPRDGSLYVGSATAAGGFWSRWSEYRANGHGGNVALVGREPSDFVVSVLQVAGSTDTIDDILAAEARWKAKLLSRELGLNRN